MPVCKLKYDETTYKTIESTLSKEIDTLRKKINDEENAQLRAIQEYEVRINQLRADLALKGSGSYPEIIKRAFAEMKKEGLIEDYYFVVNGGKFSKGYVGIKLPSNWYQDFSKS